MPTDKRIRYTTYANPRLRRNSAGYLVASTDFELIEYPVCATVQLSVDSIAQHALNPLPVDIVVNKENDYDGFLDITLGVKGAGGTFIEIYTSGPVDWDGSKSIVINVPDVGYFNTPLELEYRVLPVYNPLQTAEFLGLEDKLMSDNGVPATLTVLKGLIAGTVPVMQSMYSVSTENGYLSPNNITPPQFGSNGRGREAYVIGEFYLPDSVSDVEPVPKMYLTINTQYNENCGGMGYKTPPIVGMVRVYDQLQSNNFQNLTFLSLSDIVPHSYGKYVYTVPSDITERGKFIAVVMEDVIVPGEFVSTAVTSMKLEVKTGPEPTEDFRTIKRVSIDCTEVPLRTTTVMTLKVILPEGAGPVTKKTYSITYDSKRVSIPVYTDYMGLVSYSLEDDRGRIVDRGTFPVSSDGYDTQILADPSNYLYTRLEYYLITSGKVSSVQEKNPWSQRFNVTLAERSKVDFDYSEITLNVDSKPEGISINIVRLEDQHNTYEVTVSNISNTPAPTSSVPIVLKPQRVSGVPRADLEIFTQKSIPCDIYVAVIPVLPVFTPVAPNTDLGIITSSMWQPGQVYTYTQIRLYNSTWSLEEVPAGTPLKVGSEGAITWGIGLTVVPTKSIKYPKDSHYRLDYTFLNGLNANVNYYVRGDINGVYPNTLRFPLLGPPASPVDPWYSPSYTRGDWVNLGISSSIGIEPPQGYHQVNLKLLKLNTAVDDALDIVIMPSQTTALTMATDFKFFSKAN